MCDLNLLCPSSPITQSLHLWCRPHRGRHLSPLEIPLTSFVWSSLATTPGSPHRSPGVSCQLVLKMTIRESSRTWWRSLAKAPCNGENNCLVWALAPLWTAHTPTPTSDCLWPAQGAARLASISVLPSCGGRTMTTAGAEWLTAPLTFWASMSFSQVRLYFPLSSRMNRTATQTVIKARQVYLPHQIYIVKWRNKCNN